MALSGKSDPAHGRLENYRCKHPPARGRSIPARYIKADVASGALRLAVEERFAALRREVERSPVRPWGGDRQLVGMQPCQLRRNPIFGRFNEHVGKSVRSGNRELTRIVEPGIEKAAFAGVVREPASRTHSISANAVT